MVLRIAAETVGTYRNLMKDGEDAPTAEEVVERVHDRCTIAYRGRLRPVINATGIVLHTNLGRSPLAADVWERVQAANTAYSNLELDLGTGKRGMRRGLVPDLVSLLVGSESALLVNNCAAAVYLMLAALTAGREVIVSRGEQIQIGGGFRIPDILRLSGARLVEVGTTNVTTTADYTGAVTSDTAMALLVHNSNFRIQGFTDRPQPRDVVHSVPSEVIVAVDQGSGTTTESIPEETQVRHYLKSGVNLVCFSGDKILGGPQAGLVVGRRDLIQQMEKHPLARIVRPGKTIRSLMEEHLVHKLNGGTQSLVESVLSADLSELRRRARAIKRGMGSGVLGVVTSSAAIGGGSAPGETFPSLSVEIRSDREPDELLSAFRNWDPPIIGTISGHRAQLNLCTIRPDEIKKVAAATRAILGAPSQ